MQQIPVESRRERNVTLGNKISKNTACHFLCYFLHSKKHLSEPLGFVEARTEKQQWYQRGKRRRATAAVNESTVLTDEAFTSKAFRSFSKIVRLLTFQCKLDHTKALTTRGGLNSVFIPHAKKAVQYLCFANSGHAIILSLRNSLLHVNSKYMYLFPIANCYVFYGLHVQR